MKRVAIGALNGLMPTQTLLASVSSTLQLFFEVGIPQRFLTNKLDETVIGGIVVAAKLISPSSYP
jgi:hypothetical protein